MARLPLGFSDFDQVGRFGRELALAMAREGARGEALVIGSTTCGWSLNIDQPAHAFDEHGPGASDVDVVLKSAELLMKMKQAGGKPDPATSFLGKYVWLVNDGPHGLLTVCPHLGAFVTKWSRELGRPVDLRLLLAVPGSAVEHIDTMLDYDPGPILLFPVDVFPPA